MKYLLLSIFSGLLFCQCEMVQGPSSSGQSLTDSGLTRWERTEAAKSHPLTKDRSDPMNKVQSREGAVGYRVMEF